jgi:proteasome lid subunit RPN8/RPN11
MVHPPDDELDITLGPFSDAPPIWCLRPSWEAHSATPVGAPERESIPCFLRVSAVEAMFDHALEHPQVEAGGMLVGRVCRDEAGGYLRVEGVVPALLAQRTMTRLTFTHEAWAQVHADLAARFPHLQVVGWFHTHPGLRVFFSAPDLFLHRSLFRRPSDVAVVLDLFSRQWGLFSWHGDCPELAAGFFVYAQEPEEGKRLPRMLESCPPATGSDAR